MSQVTTHEAQIDFLALEAAGTVNFHSSEKLDAPEELTPEKLAARREKFMRMIIATRREHVTSRTSRYTTRKGEHRTFEVEEGEADLYILEDQPNEPQYTASATETRGGTARMSDEG